MTEAWDHPGEPSQVALCIPTIPPGVVDPSDPEESLLWFIRDECYMRVLELEADLPIVESVRIAPDGISAYIACADEASRNRLLCFSPFKTEMGTEVHLALPPDPTYDASRRTMQNILAHRHQWLSKVALEHPGPQPVEWPGSKHVSAVKDEVLRTKLCVFGRYKPPEWAAHHVTDFLNGYFKVIQKEVPNFRPPVIASAWAYEGRSFLTLACKDEYSRWALLLLKAAFFETPLGIENMRQGGKSWMQFEPFYDFRRAAGSSNQPFALTPSSSSVTHPGGHLPDFAEPPLSSDGFGPGGLPPCPDFYGRGPDVLAHGGGTAPPWRWPADGPRPGIQTTQDPAVHMASPHGGFSPVPPTGHSPVPGGGSPRSGPLPYRFDSERCAQSRSPSPRGKKDRRRRRPRAGKGRSRSRSRSRSPSLDGRRAGRRGDRLPRWGGRPRRRSRSRSREDEAHLASRGEPPRSRQNGGAPWRGPLRPHVIEGGLESDPFAHLAHVPIALVDEWPIGFSPAHPNSHLASQLKAKFGIFITDDLAPSPTANGEAVVPLAARDVRELSNHLRWSLYQKAVELQYPVPIVEAVGTDGGSSTTRLVVCADMLSRAIFLHMETMMLHFDDSGGITRIRFVPFQVSGYPTFPVEKDLRLPSAVLPADRTRVFWPTDQAIDGSSGGAETGVDERTLETLRERLCLTIHFKPRSWNAQQLGLFLDSLFERLRTKCGLTKPRVSEVITAIGTSTAIVAFTDETSRIRVLFLRAAYLPSSEAASNERSGMRGFLCVTPFCPEHLPMSLGQIKPDTRPNLALSLGPRPAHVPVVVPPPAAIVPPSLPVPQDAQAAASLSLLDGLQKVVQSIQQQKVGPPGSRIPILEPSPSMDRRATHHQRPVVLTPPHAQAPPVVSPSPQIDPSANAAKPATDIQPLLSALSSLASSLQQQRPETGATTPAEQSSDAEPAPPTGSIPPTAAAKLAQVASQLSALQSEGPTGLGRATPPQ